MKQLFSFSRWVFDSTLRTSVGMTVLTLLAIIGLSSANAALTTSYDVTNNPQMRLSTTISPTQTTGITISPLQKNGDTVIFPNSTGGVLRIRNGSSFEDISFTGATINSTTKEVTLLGVTRDICWNIDDRFVTCANGDQWFNGDIVELNVDARLLNFKVNKDRVNLLTGSGQISGTGTGQSILDLPCVTTTQRDNMTNVSNGNIICNSTLGTFQYRSGGAWISFGSGSVNNASDTLAGKIQDGTLSDLQNRTMTGATGALNALTFRWIVKNGSGAETYGRVLQAGSNGALSPSLGGSGLSNPTASGVLVGNGNKNSMLQITGSSGQYLRLNGKNSWFAWTPSPTLSQWSQPNDKLTASSGDQNFATTYAIPASIATGSVVIVEATGTGASTGAIYRYGLKLGSTEICLGNAQDAGETAAIWDLKAELMVYRNGTQGQLITKCKINGQSLASFSGSRVSINTTSPNTVNLFLRSNGTTAYSFLTDYRVTTFSR